MKNPSRRKWRSKKQCAKRRGIDFNLTYEDYMLLLEKAGITYLDVGLGSDAYCLARYNDEGDYSVNNCRFITNRENNKEAETTKRLHGLPLGGGSYPSCKGSAHYKDRGLINTPWGVFETIRDAANHPSATCSAATVHRRIIKNVFGYFYS